MPEQRRGNESPPRKLLWSLALLSASMPWATCAQEPREIEGKPLRESVPDYSAQLEDEQVSRLQDMLRSYHKQQAEAAHSQPTSEELEQRREASDQAAKLSPIPYNADKVRLSGAEGSLALAEISRRLADPSVPESRRDYRPVCSIRTYLMGSLIAGESRTLRPVGKHHYLLKQTLQPGNTTINIAGHSWKVNIPEENSSEAYLITLYKPPGSDPQFHVFPVAGLLAAENAHIPAWLPRELQLNQQG